MYRDPTLEGTAPATVGEAALVRGVLDGPVLGRDATRCPLGVASRSWAGLGVALLEAARARRAPVREDPPPIVLPFVRADSSRTSRRPWCSWARTSSSRAWRSGRCSAPCSRRRASPPAQAGAGRATGGSAAAASSAAGRGGEPARCTARLYAWETNDASRVIDDLPPGGAATAVIWDPGTYAFRNGTLTHLAAYYAARKHGAWAFAFARYLSVPGALQAPARSPRGRPRAGSSTPTSTTRAASTPAPSRWSSSRPPSEVPSDASGEPAVRKLVFKQDAQAAAPALAPRPLLGLRHRRAPGRRHAVGRAAMLVGVSGPPRCDSPWPSASSARSGSSAIIFASYMLHFALVRVFAPRGAATSAAWLKARRKRVDVRNARRLLRGHAPAAGRLHQARAGAEHPGRLPPARFTQGAREPAGPGPPAPVPPRRADLRRELRQAPRGVLRVDRARAHRRRVARAGARRGAAGRREGRRQGALPAHPRRHPRRHARAQDRHQGHQALVPGPEPRDRAPLARRPAAPRDRLPARGRVHGADGEELRRRAGHPLPRGGPRADDAGHPDHDLHGGRQDHALRGARSAGHRPPASSRRASCSRSTSSSSSTASSTPIRTRGTSSCRRGPSGEPRIVVLDFGAISEVADALVDGALAGAPGHHDRRRGDGAEGLPRHGVRRRGRQREAPRADGDDLLQEAAQDQGPQRRRADARRPPRAREAGRTPRSSATSCGS